MSEKRAAIELVSHFHAQLDSGLRRASCVVKFNFSLDVFMCFISYDNKHRNLERALAGLTGFRTVELKVACHHQRDISYQNWEMRHLVPTFDRLGVFLETGEVVRDTGGMVCAKFHPRSG